MSSHNDTTLFPGTQKNARLTARFFVCLSVKKMILSLGVFLYLTVSQYYNNS